MSSGCARSAMLLTVHTHTHEKSLSSLYLIYSLPLYSCYYRFGIMYSTKSVIAFEMRNCSVETGAANQIQRWILMSSTLIAIKSSVHFALHI